MSWRRSAIKEVNDWDLSLGLSDNASIIFFWYKIFNSKKKNITIYTIRKLKWKMGQLFSTTTIFLVLYIIYKYFVLLGLFIFSLLLQDVSLLFIQMSSPKKKLLTLKKLLLHLCTTTTTVYYQWLIFGDKCNK